MNGPAYAVSVFPLVIPPDFSRIQPHFLVFRADRRNEEEMNMADTVLAAQLYTVRQFTKTPSDLAATLDRIRKIGYRAVQISGIGPMDPREVARILKEAGMICCATHVGIADFTDRFDETVANHKLWGCEFPGIGGFNKKEGLSAADIVAFARQFDAIGARLREQGLTFVYHNHHHEFARYDGRLGMDLIMENSSGNNVTMELDTHWVVRGGGDPAAWVAKCARRGPVPVIHLKDFAVNPADKTPIFAEVGEGNLNWPAILDACKKAGVRWYCVEQDVCQRDPFESLAISYRNLTSWGLK
jgi:sugar phosphate isomerase/epimerase